MLASLYHAAAALVYTSLYEGFGQPPIEAMSAGCPVVAYRGSSITEVCEGFAVLVETNEVEAWSDAINSVISDEALNKTLRTNGRQRSAEFTWSRCAELMHEAYRTTFA